MMFRNFDSLVNRVGGVLITAGLAMLAPMSATAESDVAGTIQTYNTQTVTCPRNGRPASDFYDIVLDLNELKIDAQEDDPGGDYELRFYAEVAVYPVRLAPGELLTPDKMVCGWLLGQFYQEYDIPDLVMGQYYTFPFWRRLVVENVPRSSELVFRLSVDEIDDWTGDDYGAIDPTTGEHRLELHVFPHADFTLIGKDGLRVFPDGLPFGQVMTVAGRGSDFSAGVTFKVTANEPRQVGGAIPMPGIGSGSSGLTTPPDIELICRDYALKSVEQNIEASNLSCGFVPPVWSNDHQMHFDWCMQGQNHVQTQPALDRRASELAACAQRQSQIQSPGQVCRDYADRSVEQFQQSQQRGCGFPPPVWSGDWDGHFAWCMAVGGPVAMPELAKRDAALAGCGG